MSEDRKIKGRVLKSYGKFIKSKWGADGLNNCCKYLDFDLMDVGDDVWYPNEYSEKAQQWIVDNHGLNYCKLMGRTITTEVGIISYVARIAGIKRVIENAANEVRNSVHHGGVTPEFVNGGGSCTYEMRWQ